MNHFRVLESGARSVPGDEVAERILETGLPTLAVAVWAFLACLALSLSAMN
jgi:hypothetical protein